MTTTDKLTHIKARLREIVGNKLGRNTEFATLAAENWIEMIEYIEFHNRYAGHEEPLLKTISRWESVYGTIEEETR